MIGDIVSPRQSEKCHIYGFNLAKVRPIHLPRVAACLICFTPIVRNSCFALSSV